MGKMLIPVSFKERERDLFELANRQGDKSNFMKDALKFYIQNRDGKVKTPDKSEVENGGILDILENV
jgi:hypothetical protein